MEIKLSISLLASNRVNSLKLCLESLKPLLQKVPSELIVVLTSDNEEVREVVSQYTDIIIPFIWCDDFSAARNAGLEQAKGEWLLWIDDDEWFEDVTEICDFFLSGEYKNYYSAHYIQRNYHTWDGFSYSDLNAHRMTCLFPESHFYNPVHEVIRPCHTPFKYFSAFAHHYGYVKDTKCQKNIKKDRNIPLLMKAVKEDPTDTHHYYQIAQEYMADKDWEEADKWCMKGLHLSKSNNEINTIRWFSHKKIYITFQRMDYTQAITEAEKFLKYGFSNTVEPCELDKLLLYQWLISLYTALKKSSEAVKYGVEFERLLKYVDNHPRLWKEQICGDLSEYKVKEKNTLRKVRINSIVSAFELKDLENAEYFLSLLPWNTEEEMRSYYPIFDELKEKYQPDIQNVLEKLSYDSPYLMLQKAINSGDFSECMQFSEDHYLKSQIIKEALLQQADISDMLNDIDFIQWKTCIETIKEEFPMKKIPEISEMSESLSETHPFHAAWLKKMALEKELFRSYASGQELLSLMEEYCQCILQFYKGLYAENLFYKEGMRNLPTDCRFAVIILDTLESLRQKKLIESVHLLRQALPLYPDMKRIIKELASYMEKEMNQPAANPELEQLADQMKTALKGMIENNQCSEALNVVNQLLVVLPDDLEFLKIRQQVLRKGAEKHVVIR